MRSNWRASECVVAATLRSSCSVSASSRWYRSPHRAWSSRWSQPWHGCTRRARRSVASSGSSSAVVFLRPRDGTVMPVLRIDDARSRRDLGERTSTCRGSRMWPSTSTGAGKSADVSRPDQRSSVTTSGRASPSGSMPGSMTTARPLRLPDGTAITSPLRSVSSDLAVSMRRAFVFCLASCFSRSAIRRRSEAYSAKSPRWHVMASV